MTPTLATEQKKQLQLPPTDHTPRPYTGPSREEILAMRREYTNPAIFTIYREPLMIVEGHMQWMWDETGKRYLDGFAGIVSVSLGHCHPDIVERVREQIGTLQHTTTIYLHPAIAELGLEPASRVWRVGVMALPQCGTNDEVLVHHKLDVASLVSSFKRAVPQIA